MKGHICIYVSDAAPSDKPSELKALLETCPISEQLHFGLEIVFTKPIQRVLQYPLYLHVLLKQLPQDSQEKRDIQGKSKVIV